MAYKHIVIVTGAGISAESGIQTFRGEDGLWNPALINDIATPQGFNANPEYAHGFYNRGRREILAAKPNAAHEALAKLAAEYPGKVTIITQNVDHLHSVAAKAQPPKPGSALYYMHGELLKARKQRFDEKSQSWQETGDIIPMFDDITAASPHVTDGRLRSLRPHTVWFGEEPLYVKEVSAALEDCDLLVAIGTSGHVPPANMFPAYVKTRALQGGKPAADTVEINAFPTGDSNFDRVIEGAATETVPAWVDELLAEKDRTPWAEKPGTRDRSRGGPLR